MEVKAMRRNLAVLASAFALAAAGCAPHAAHLGGGPSTAEPSRPAAIPVAAVAPPPVLPERSAAAQVARVPAAPPTAKWNENHAGLEGADTPDCLGCHGEAMKAHSHPTEIDYAEAAGRFRGRYRPIEEVRARGVVLPGGQVGCPTCHSAGSPWAHFLAVPRELARPRAGVAELRAEEPAKEPQAQALAEGAEVSPRPLCESCHAY
jgi:hypothetical protein